MFYKNWMSYLKDEAKITKVAMPGSHNSATMGMPFVAECQKGSLYDQYACGVRMFDIRLKMTRNGKLYAAHGITKGMPAQQVFKNLKTVIDESDEFFVLGIKTYTNQKIGPVTLKYQGNSDETNRLIKEYLSPEKFAFTDFENINDVTLGDIRKSGKKYIIINKDKEYDYSCDCPMPDLWDKQIFGCKPEKFASAVVELLRAAPADGFLWFQTQETPNFGTENGISKFPNKLDLVNKPYFPRITAQIASDPLLLEKVGIIAGDFMTADLLKANEILNLNLLKGIVKEDLVGKFAAEIGK